MSRGDFTVIVSGDREYTNYSFIYDTLRELLAQYGTGLHVIQGGARGADTLARQACDSLGISCETVKAEWEAEGKAAGPIRNKRMLDLKPQLVLAFHDRIQQSKGTLNMLTIATKKGVPCILLSVHREMLPWDAHSSTIPAFQTPAMKAIGKAVKA